METVAHVISSPEPAVTDSAAPSVADNSDDSGECCVYNYSIITAWCSSQGEPFLQTITVGKLKEW